MPYVVNPQGSYLEIPENCDTQALESHGCKVFKDSATLRQYFEEQDINVPRNAPTLYIKWDTGFTVVGSVPYNQED